MTMASVIPECYGRIATVTNATSVEPPDEYVTSHAGPEPHTDVLQ